jgi:hypothetical protein
VTAATEPLTTRPLGAQPLQAPQVGEAQRRIDLAAGRRGVEPGDQAARGAAIDRPARILGGEPAPPMAFGGEHHADPGDTVGIGQDPGAGDERAAVSARALPLAGGEHELPV